MSGIVFAFQHTAARRRLSGKIKITLKTVVFQHTAARRRLTWANTDLPPAVVVSTHSRPKAAEAVGIAHRIIRHVSTHSRPKAADVAASPNPPAALGFNTQPPEGG